jgi:hypothetical protein
MIRVSRELCVHSKGEASGLMKMWDRRDAHQFFGHDAVALGGCSRDSREGARKFEKPSWRVSLDLELCCSSSRQSYASRQGEFLAIHFWF